MKPCRKCKTIYRASKREISRGDYLCKACKREYDAKWRARRRAQGLPASGGKKSREWHRAYEKEYYQRKNIKKRRSMLMRKYRNDPRLRERHAARELTGRAIKSGRLVKKPCEKCWQMPTEAHHSDYAKPLEVRWLCKPCHRAEHAKTQEVQP